MDNVQSVLLHSSMYILLTSEDAHSLLADHDGEVVRLALKEGRFQFCGFAVPEVTVSMYNMENGTHYVEQYFNIDLPTIRGGRCDPEDLPLQLRQPCAEEIFSQLQGESDISKISKIIAELEDETAKDVLKLYACATGFHYNTPQEAWQAEGGGKPFPKTAAQVCLESPPSPQQYICDHVGLYDGNAAGYWFAYICPALGDFPDMETGYKEAVDRYLELHPDFDMKQLDFIQEDNKEAVFQNILHISELDPQDPFRAWTRNPPEEFRAYKRENPQLSYVEIFRMIYDIRHKCARFSCFPDFA